VSKATALNRWLRYYEDAQKEVCSFLLPTLTFLATALYAGHQAEERIPGKNTPSRRSRGRVCVTLVHPMYTNSSTAPNLHPIMIWATTTRPRHGSPRVTPVHPNVLVPFPSALRSDSRKFSARPLHPRGLLPHPMQQVKLPRKRKKSRPKSTRARAEPSKHPRRSLRRPLLPCHHPCHRRKRRLPHPRHRLPLLQFCWRGCLYHHQPYLSCSHALQPSCLSDPSTSHLLGNIPTVFRAQSLLNG
jgi:hypothetical protein